MGELRIIAGALRRRRIEVLRGFRVRPTAERVREALFSILAPDLPDARVLDAYAGTGALGFEALSRGARHVTFLESAPDVVELLRRNALRLNVVERCRIAGGSAEALLRRRALGSEPFDLVLADPPYADRIGEAFLDALAASGLLAPAAVVVLERDARTAAAESSALRLVRSERYGRTRLDFYAVTRS